MKLNPYLAFDGRCREAFEFYAKAFGGKISFIQTIGESPMASSVPPRASRARARSASCTVSAAPGPSTAR